MYSCAHHIHIVFSHTYFTQHESITMMEASISIMQPQCFQHYIHVQSFVGVNFDTIRQSEAPIIPVVSKEDDVSNFDQFKDDEPSDCSEDEENDDFLGFTFKQKKDTGKTQVTMENAFGDSDDDD